jgi:hypothetical protein
MTRRSLKAGRATLGASFALVLLASLLVCACSTTANIPGLGAALAFHKFRSTGPAKKPRWPRARLGQAALPKAAQVGAGMGIAGQFDRG